MRVRIQAPVFLRAAETPPATITVKDCDVQCSCCGLLRRALRTGHPPRPLFALRPIAGAHIVAADERRNSPMNDTDLLRRVGAGDRAALKALYERYSDPVSYTHLTLPTN